MHRRSVTAAAGTLLGVTALFLSSTNALAAGHHHARPTIVGHRGDPTYAPENTLASVDAAHARGVTWVENDVQRTKDGKLIVLHDTTLNRTTNVEELFPDRSPWKVADFTLAEVKKLDAGSWFDPSFSGERIPTLDQYMNRITRNHQNLLMEMKSPDLYPGIERETLRKLREHGWLDRQHVKRRLIVQSFDADSMREIHSLRPDVKTGFLGNPEVDKLPEYATFVDQINPTHTAATKDYVAAVHKLKGVHHKRMEVFSWTVDDGDTAAGLVDAGVDGIISNAPDIVRDALADKGRPVAAETS